MRRGESGGYVVPSSNDHDTPDRVGRRD